MKEIRHDIKESLTYGKLFLGKTKFFLYIVLGVSLLLPIFTLALYIVSNFNIVTLLNEKTIMLICANIVPLLLFLVILIRIIYNYGLVKKVSLWLEDAVLLQAKARRLDLVDAKFKPYQIEVKFSYKNKIQKHISRAGNIFLGYYKFFIESEKNIEILYSPKYNEVMILKDTY